eukprot:4621892-Pleurochrysis_carterae.AAC.1
MSCCIARFTNYSNSNSDFAYARLLRSRLEGRSERPNQRLLMCSVAPGRRCPRNNNAVSNEVTLGRGSKASFKQRTRTV